MATGAVGDPHFSTVFGVEFEFHGQAGQSYLVLGYEDLLVTGRVKAIEDERTAFDRVTIRAGDHVVVVAIEGVTVDAGPVLYEHRVGNDWITVHTHSIGYDGWIEVRHAGGVVAVHRDDGSHEDLVGTCLAGVHHCSIHVANPDEWKQGVGLLVRGYQDCDPASFAVGESN